MSWLSIAGQTAAYVDLEDSLAAHIPAVLSVIVAATLIVLFLFTGSVVLPIKAVIMNALSLSAVFGRRRGVRPGHRLRRHRLSRIKEARDAGAADSEAVAIGLGRTGRIVTAAALLS